MAGREMFIFQYEHKDFLHGDQEMWIMWDDILLQGDALLRQTHMFVLTISLIFIWFIIYNCAIILNV
jgi:hypothetical protein